jgi:hypothetical protein
MSATDWIIRLAIFGVLAVAVVGALQNIVGGLRDAARQRRHAGPGA